MGNNLLFEEMDMKFVYGLQTREAWHKVLANFVRVELTSFLLTQILQIIKLYYDVVNVEVRACCTTLLAL
jgi:hypothetical protein